MPRKKNIIRDIESRIIQKANVGQTKSRFTGEVDSDSAFSTAENVTFKGPNGQTMKPFILDISTLDDPYSVLL